MKKRKMLVITGALLISLTAGGVAAMADTNIVAETDTVKVFVGAVSQNNILTRNSFVNERVATIEENSLYTPQERETALITFDEYLTPEEADDFTKSLGECQVKEIFLGIPNQDGRTIIGKLGTGTISERVKENFCNMLEEEQDETMQALLLEYQKNSKVFAVTVEATNSQITEASKTDVAAFVDVYDYPKAEEMAQRKNVSVSYIAVPDKPDNSH